MSRVNTNFWSKLKKPFFVLAPMADVTDSAFRQIIAKYGKPDVFFTEFVSCDGLCSEEGRKKLIKDLYFTESERPIVAQIFGGKPQNFYETAKLIASLGFDGIDINMGCPEKKIIKQCAGSDLIRNPELAKEIIRETKRGAGNLPVSVKTRIGFNKNEIEEWLPKILEEKPVAITIHGRTRKDMSKTPARWDVIGRAVEIAKGSCVLIIGNGDVKDIDDGIKKIKERGVDGVMIGRAIFGNPTLFAGLTETLNMVENSSSLNAHRDAQFVCHASRGTNWRLAVMLEHTKLFEKIYGDTEENRKIFGGRARNFAVMKKHYKAYVNGFDGAKELRMKLMNAEDLKEVEKITKEFLKNNK